MGRVVSTPMLINEPTFKLFLPDSANPTVDEFAAGVALPVDAGLLINR